MWFMFNCAQQKAPYTAKSEDHDEEVRCAVTTEDPAFNLHFKKTINIECEYLACS